MIYKLQGAPTYIRVLSNQLTGHVVWMSQEPAKGITSGIRVPMCVPGLDYVTYVGPGPSDVQSFYSALKNYQLVCNMSTQPTQFEIEPLPAEFVDRLKLYRAKCYAMQSIQNTVTWALEKNGLFSNPIVDDTLDFDKLSGIYQRQHNLNKQSADKLLLFKIQEHTTGVENIKYVQIEAEMSVTNAGSVPEVLEIYKNFLVSVGMSRISADVIMRFV